MTKCVPVILNGYLRVLGTCSGHRSLNDDSFDGRIVKGYLTTLYVAKWK
jgi:hypothetical protein